MDARTIIGLFDSREKAIAAIQDLKARGFSETDMGLLSREGGRAEGVDSIPEKTDRAAAGGLGGAFIGASVGTLVGLGVLAGVVPVIGPAIAAGTLGVLVTNAAGGMAVAGLAGALVGYGLNRDEAEEFENEVKAGKTIVTVRTDNVSDAVVTLQQHGAEVREGQRKPADQQDEPTKPYDAMAAQPMFSDVGPGSTLSEPTDVTLQPATSKEATPEFEHTREELSANRPPHGVDLASTGASVAPPGYAAHSQPVDEPGVTEPATPREDIPNPRAYRDDSAATEPREDPPRDFLTQYAETKVADTPNDDLGNNQPVLPAAPENSTPVLPPQPPRPLDADPALLVPVFEDEDEKRGSDIPGDEAKQSDIADATQPAAETPASWTRTGQRQTQRPASPEEEKKPLPSPEPKPEKKVE
ncbi:MAG TPA: hypothetical protein VEJ63_06435 [Planctomycetota bacterium]|nr:hypothetical protein [Planctomycetota bacterium]